eukprot:scaffold65476_cov20-Tisochrysis_lutea.AAC.1
MGGGHTSTQGNNAHCLQSGMTPKLPPTLPFAFFSETVTPKHLEYHIHTHTRAHTHTCTHTHRFWARRACLPEPTSTPAKRHAGASSKTSQSATQPTVCGHWARCTAMECRCVFFQESITQRSTRRCAAGSLRVGAEHTAPEGSAALGDAWCGVMLLMGEEGVTLACLPAGAALQKHWQMPGGAMPCQ